MSIPAYTQGYPPDGSTLGQTKTTIRSNLDGTFLTLGIDHVNNNGVPGSNPAGYHTVIHQTLQSVDPGLIANVNQLYSKNYTTPNGGTQTQLYTINSGGGISQLTGSSSNAEGWQWIGGVLLQWGSVLFSNSNPTLGTVNFQATGTTRLPNGINFPLNCFNVTTGFTGNITSGTTTGIVVINSISSTNFTWTANRSTSSAVTGFYWQAIGN